MSLLILTPCQGCGFSVTQDQGRCPWLYVLRPAGAYFLADMRQLEASLLHDWPHHLASATLSMQIRSLAAVVCVSIQMTARLSSLLNGKVLCRRSAPWNLGLTDNPRQQIAAVG